ncbi:transposase [Streptomyces sp. 21So2-11]|uniref:transposase n=1 Tax=Streptomyces sp. 21So2-11 TaxID=3144408 RepID=UPI00321943A7
MLQALLQTARPAFGDLHISPDDSGDRKSGHATVYVSRQYLGSRGQVGNGIVTVTTARADECVHCPPHTVPHQPAPTLPQGPADPAFRTKGQLAAHLVARATRIAFRALVTECLYNPSESPHTVADHPADAMHLPLPSGPLTPCHPPLPQCRAPEICPLPPADMAGIVRCTGCAAGPSILLRFMFAERRFHRCGARIFAHNKLPMTLHRRLGFRRRGRKPMVRATPVDKPTRNLNLCGVPDPVVPTFSA